MGPVEWTWLCPVGSTYFPPAARRLTLATPATKLRALHQVPRGHAAGVKQGSRSILPKNPALPRNGRRIRLRNSHCAQAWEGAEGNRRFHSQARRPAWCDCAWDRPCITPEGRAGGATEIES
ncbi:hypothetical protein PSm6_02410 [Pseudomonas solani]|uniref:Uncharacterized protein n=1 Tax=Pseudomonas solani TaxID=2731552 RepID=A0ABM7L2Q2_9PSED|nr:hypothetical protein PSm6_02410 [Pseudomonas solani]